MPHYHHCLTCNIPVAMCSDDSCKGDDAHANAGDHYCSLHHLDPRYHVEPGPVPGRNITASSITVIHQNKP